MPTFILIFTFYAGTFAHTDSIALSTTEFTTMSKCQQAGEQAKKRFETPLKTANYICVEK